MRTLTATQLSAQKGRRCDPICRIVLTYGASTYTYDFRRVATASTRILKVAHSEKQWSQIANVILNDSDKTLTSLDLEGYKGVISYGFTTSAGDEWSATAPLWVVGQQRDSAQGKVICSLSLEGIFDRMVKDKASAAYTQASGDTNTVKTLLTAIAGATLAPFTHCKAYTVTYDSEDSLIDSFIPADFFRVRKNETRLSKFQELLRYTTCKARVESDGNIHIFVPSTDGIFEYHDSGDDANATPSGAIWRAQTFTPQEDHKITSVKLYLYRVGSPGTLTVSIRATDGDGHPTGADLCSGTTNGNTLPTASPYEWREITLGDGYDLTASTKYAIILRALSGDESNRPLWRYQDAGAYSNGNLERSLNSGVTWTSSNDDALFKEYGYNYVYSLATDYHTFLNKRYRRRVVSPNYVIVKTDPDIEPPAYTGFAKDDSADLTDMEEKETHYLRATSNAQCTSLATAILSRYQLQDEQGAGILPIMNIGAEAYDFNKVTDSRAGDSVTGNVGYITRNVAGNRFGMTFGFGRDSSVPFELFAGLGTGDVSGISTAALAEALLAFQDTFIDFLKQIQDGISWTKELMPESLDDLTDGTTYAKVLKTDISAGHILLSSVTGDATQWTGVLLDADVGILLYGGAGINALRTYPTLADAQAGTNLQCYVGTDGKIYAGAGAVILDASGITITGQNLIMKYGAAIVGYVYPVSGGLQVGAANADILIGTNSGYGVRIHAGSNPVTVPANTLKLDAVDDIIVAATDDLDMRGDEVYISSGGNTAVPGEDDIIIDAGDDLWLYGETDILIKPAQTSTAGRAKIDKMDSTAQSIGSLKDTIYQNTSGKLLLAMVTIILDPGDEAIAQIEDVNPPTITVSRALLSGAAGTQTRATLTFLVPSLYYYRVATNAGTIGIFGWVEYTIG